MTIEPGYNDYTTNGIETTFAFDFALEQETDLKVYFTPSGGTYDPATDIITNYVVTINPLPTIGGHIVVTPAPADGGELILRKEMVLEVPTSFADVTTFNGAALDAAIQRLVNLIQQVSFEANNDALHYPPNAPGLNDNITQVGVLGEGQFWQRVGDAIIAVTLSDEPGSSVLSQLASETEGADGSLLVGTYMPAPDPTPAETLLGGMTVHEALYWAVSQIQILKTDIAANNWMTGDVKMTLRTTPDTGWILMDDGTIGNASSGASNLADASAQELFEYIWDSVANEWAPVYTSTGEETSKGAHASEDFAANKRIALTKTAGRMILNGATNNQPNIYMIFEAFMSSDYLIEPKINGVTVDLSIFYTGMEIAGLTTTGSLPTLLSTGTIYYVVKAPLGIKLAATREDAVAGTFIQFTDDGTGVHTLEIAGQTGFDHGRFGGSFERNIVISQLPPHFHDESFRHGDPLNLGSDPDNRGIVLTGGTDITAETGSADALDVRPPYGVLNLMIKL